MDGMEKIRFGQSYAVFNVELQLLPALRTVAAWTSEPRVFFPEFCHVQVCSLIGRDSEQDLI